MQFLGPVFWYDLTRMGRQGRYSVFRCLFALVLLLILYVLYLGFARDVQEYASLQVAGRGLNIHGVRIDPNAVHRHRAQIAQLIQARMSLFGEHFFTIYMCVQILMLTLLTPAMVAGAIAEEKQRKTMDFLLTTELTRAEMVLGKLCSRLLVLFLLMMAGLPVLSMVQLFGGIDHELLWAGFAGSLILMLSLSSLSLLVSVYARRVRESIVKAYLVIVGYGVVWGIFLLFRAFMLMDGKSTNTSVQTLDAVLAVYNWGNPLAAMTALQQHVAATGNLGQKHWELLAEFTLFHGLVIGLSLTLAVWQVRRVYVRQNYESTRRAKAMDTPSAEGKPPHKTSWLFRPRRRPPVSDAPMQWKERYCERTFRFGVLGQSLLLLSIILLLSPVVVFAAANLPELFSGRSNAEFGRMINGYLRVAGAVFLQLILIAVGVRAAGSVGLEKDRQTWESLLSTPLPILHILWAKLWHSIWSVRWLFLILVLMWFGGLLSNGLHWLALPILLLNSLTALVLAAAIGIYCTVRFPTTLRSMLMTVAGLMLISLVPLVLSALPASWTRDQVWQNTMNLSPLRMVYVTSICPANDFEGWAQFQRFQYRGGGGMSVYLSSRQHDEEIALYLGMTLSLNLMVLLCSLGILLNAWLVAQRECGRIDYAKTRFQRFQPIPYRRVKPRERWG